MLLFSHNELFPLRTPLLGSAGGSENWGSLGSWGRKAYPDSLATLQGSQELFSATPDMSSSRYKPTSCTSQFINADTSSPNQYKTMND